jgi:hypothetical protein
LLKTKSFGIAAFCYRGVQLKHGECRRKNKREQAEMRAPDDRNLILMYIYLATGVVMLGVGITFLVLFICAYYGIDITKNLWLLAIPPASSLLINVLLIELYRKLTRR